MIYKNEWDACFNHITQQLKIFKLIMFKLIAETYQLPD